jgi:uncharacterized surface protein with fasciclin (FAS1) repeats
VVLAGAVAALAITVAACGGPKPIEGQPSNAPNSPTPVGSADTGVTTPKDVFGLACNQQPQGGTPGSAERAQNSPVVNAIQANPRLTQLALALKKANLVDTLNNAPEITVFAPYDAAFTSFQQSVGPDRYNNLLAQPAQLADILKYHVIARRYDRKGLAKAARVNTLQGGSMQIKDTGQTLLITDNAGNVAHVLCGNIPTANATLFIIDHVLMSEMPHATP